MSAISVNVDYGAIADNVRTLGAVTSAQVMAVVKADGYGHGLIESSRAARTGGAQWLGVAQPGEALALRATDDVGRILTWLYGPEVPAAALIEANVDVSVGSLVVLDAILAGAKTAGRAARVHVIVDTGLSREGATLDELPALLDAVDRAQADGLVEAVGMWSHLAWADSPGHATIERQHQVFETALKMASERRLDLQFRHLANSACTLTRADLHYDLVRPGLACYGLAPVADPDGKNFGLRPAMTVTSTLSLVKAVRAGEGVSYGHEFVTSRDTVLGLVPAGYADGVFRAAGNRAKVRVGGDLVPIVGRVCMDQFVVDLGPANTALAGDTVALIGADGPTAQDWADAADTIHYDVVTRFGALRPKSDL